MHCPLPRPSVLPVLLLCLALPLTAQESATPFRLNDALGLGGGFNIGFTHRSRFEHLVDNVQPGTSPNDQALMQRTLLDLSARGDHWLARLELADMRQQLMDSDSVISTATVNTRDVLQAHVGYRFDNPGATEIRFGRFTEDWGSRRLMARNRFRNTINAWDGLVLHHALQDGGELKAMATEVVTRLPRDRQLLLDNTHEWDRSYDAQRFYGIQLDLPEVFAGLDSEWYFFALREKDTQELMTRNRRLNTLGVRLLSGSAPGQWDIEIESVVQTGKQRANATLSGLHDQDHLAWFQYLGLGYTFAVPSRLRVMLEFDYASGDEDPFDGDSGRFDSLFGPTTFEFGVVGLYNPFSRSNLVTPGLRVSAAPLPRIDVMAVYRHFWLAEAKDSWGRTGLQDPTGNSGTYLGQHLQLRLRWDAVPGNAQVEAGAIFLDAKNLSDRNTEYAYAGITLTF